MHYLIKTNIFINMEWLRFLTTLAEMTHMNVLKT